MPNLYNQTKNLAALPSTGPSHRFDSDDFFEQLKKVKKLLSREDLEKLKRDDREAQK